jgi:heme exporter protein D
MSPGAWFEFLWIESALYLWGAFLVGAVLMLIEIAVLVVREREILAHLDWKGPETRPSAARAPGMGED